MSLESAIRQKTISLHSPRSVVQCPASEWHGSDSDTSSPSETAVCRPVHRPAHRPLAHQALVAQILHTVGELEHSLVQDHQHDYKLHMALVKQREKVANLRSSLANEKQRNDRLVQLIQGADSLSSTDDEAAPRRYTASAVGGSGGDMLALDAYESISPLLMQQRYEELSISYRKCRRQLVKREKALTLCRCEKEELRSQNYHLLDEYRQLQQRFDQLCCRQLRTQAKQKNELRQMEHAINCACDCILEAHQQLLDDEGDDIWVKHDDGATTTSDTSVATGITGVSAAPAAVAAIAAAPHSAAAVAAAGTVAAAATATAATADPASSAADAAAAADAEQYPAVCDFRQNLELFIESLHQCDWLQRQRQRQRMRNK